jgi:hypothetical protein
MVRAVDSSAADRFWGKVRKGPGAACWPWAASLTEHGYGRFYYRGRVMMAHRFSWLLAHGPVADGLMLDHLCRNRRCVNPAHLEVVTNRENLLRGETFAARNAEKTHCPQGHSLSGPNLYVCPRGKRQCRSCRRSQLRAFRARGRGVV